MTKEQIIERLEKLAQSKTIIQDNKIALQEAVKAVKADIQASDVERKDFMIKQLANRCFAMSKGIFCLRCDFTNECPTLKTFENKLSEEDQKGRAMKILEESLNEWG